jgi:hypothetical protein
MQNSICVRSECPAMCYKWKANRNMPLTRQVKQRLSANALTPVVCNVVNCVLMFSVSGWCCQKYVDVAKRVMMLVMSMLVGRGPSSPALTASYQPTPSPPLYSPILWLTGQGESLGWGRQHHHAPERAGPTIIHPWAPHPLQLAWHHHPLPLSHPSTSWNFTASAWTSGWARVLYKMLGGIEKLSFIRKT